MLCWRLTGPLEAEHVGARLASSREGDRWERTQEASAGYELLQAGHDVTIVEARERPGGRVHTVRGLFSDDLYAEAGATFVPDIHHLTLSYIRLANLSLVPVPPRAGGKLYFVRGRALRLTSGASVS